MKKSPTAKYQTKEKNRVKKKGGNWEGKNWPVITLRTITPKIYGFKINTAPVFPAIYVFIVAKYIVF